MTAWLASKVIVVTGGSSGIGRAVAGRVASEGATVVIGARRADLGGQVAVGIRAKGGQALFVATDATAEADVAGLTRTAVTKLGRLDGAFNNAGGVNAAGMVHEIDGAAWRAELDQNLTSVFYGLKYQVPALLASGGGAIVNNAALAGVVGVPGMAAYTAAKHGVVGLTRAAALECAGRGVRVNALVTGTVDTCLPPYHRPLLPSLVIGTHPGPWSRTSAAACSTTSLVRPIPGSGAADAIHWSACSASRCARCWPGRGPWPPSVSGPATRPARSWPRWGCAITRGPAPGGHPVRPPCVGCWPASTPTRWIPRLAGGSPTSSHRR
jgi:NAD(P)-dependent dehydrogenase (short-subunit alcohol dehydrogenase family)